MNSSEKEWEDFNKNKEKTNYPKWPNEVMVKIIFGDYLKKRIAIKSASKILDVGCGFGNNLLPFLDVGCQCFGAEITQAMAEETEGILQKKGYHTLIRCGKNKELPFEDNFFDILLSINTIHYEKTEKDIRLAFTEYKRVLRKNGRIILITAGPKHEIFMRARPFGFHQYEVGNYDFRNGERLFFFETARYLKKIMNHFFKDVEIGRITEHLMTQKLDFFVATGAA